MWKERVVSIDQEKVLEQWVTFSTEGEAKLWIKENKSAAWDKEYFQVVKLGIVI